MPGSSWADEEEEKDQAASCGMHSRKGDFIVQNRGELKQKIGEKQETCGCFWMILVNGIDLKKEIQREKLRAYGRLRELQGAKFCRLEVPESSNLGLSDFSLTIPFG